MDISNIKEGDYAGLGSLQKQYGLVGIKKVEGENYIIMIDGSPEIFNEADCIPINQEEVFLRVDMDFKNKTDKAYFYYSLDGEKWFLIGNTLKMTYTLPHFMGYRFAIFNYATVSTGGYVDFDWFRFGKLHI